MSKNVILKNRNGEQVFPATTLEQVHYEGNLNLKQAIRQMTVHAVNASTAAEMMDAGKIYVYTGSEDGYTLGTGITGIRQHGCLADHITRQQLELERLTRSS